MGLDCFFVSTSIFFQGTCIRAGLVWRAFDLGSLCRKGYFTRVTLVGLELTVYMWTTRTVSKDKKVISPIGLLFVRPLIDPEETPRLNVSITSIHMFYKIAPIFTPTQCTCAGAQE